MAKGRMREQMPVVAALIDDLRAAFGTEFIEGIIKAGMAGQPVFHATENGHTVGTPVPAGTKVVRDEKGIPCIVVAPDGTRRREELDKGRLPMKWSKR